MSLINSVAEVAFKVAADAAKTLPSTSAGTLSLQARIFGFGATTIGEQAEAISHNKNLYVVAGAVLVGVAAVALMPEAALATATAVAVNASLPLVGGLISEAALTSLIGGVTEVGLAGIGASVAEGAINNFLGFIDKEVLDKDNPNSLGDGLQGLLPTWLGGGVGMQAGFGSVGSATGSGFSMEPLILDLNSDGAHSTKLGWGVTGSKTYFDIDNDGYAERTAWVSPSDGLLAFDRNGNGFIDNQTELFGNTATHANDNFYQIKSKVA